MNFFNVSVSIYRQIWSTIFVLILFGWLLCSNNLVTFKIVQFFVSFNFIFLGFFLSIFVLFIIIISSSNTMKLKYFCTFCITCIINIKQNNQWEEDTTDILLLMVQYSCSRHLVLCNWKPILSTGKFVDRKKGEIIFWF